MFVSRGDYLSLRYPKWIIVPLSKKSEEKGNFPIFVGGGGGEKN